MAPVRGRGAASPVTWPEPNASAGSGLEAGSQQQVHLQRRLPRPHGHPRPRSGGRQPPSRLDTDVCRLHGGVGVLRGAASRCVAPVRPCLRSVETIAPPWPVGPPNTPNGVLSGALGGVHRCVRALLSMRRGHVAVLGQRLRRMPLITPVLPGPSSDGLLHGTACPRCAGIPTRHVLREHQHELVKPPAVPRCPVRMQSRRRAFQ